MVPIFTQQVMDMSVQSVVNGVKEEMQPTMKCAEGPFSRK